MFILLFESHLGSIVQSSQWIAEAVMDDAPKQFVESLTILRTDGFRCLAKSSFHLVTC